jgi:hypothetical protein
LDLVVGVMAPLLFVLEKKETSTFVPFFTTRNFGHSFFLLLLFTSPDDEIHLDGPVEFDHVDGHHTFYPRAIFLSHFSMTGDAISCAIR